MLSNKLNINASFNAVGGSTSFALSFTASGFFSRAFLSLISVTFSASSVELIADFMGQTDILGRVVFKVRTTFLARRFKGTDPFVAARLIGLNKGIAFFPSSIDVTVTADEVSSERSSVSSGVLFVANSA